MNHSGDVISGIRLSTVVPASITPREATHQLTDTDLAFKLHQITTVHFFTGDAAANLTVPDLKKPMFYWLEVYRAICGRLRRGDDGRPFIKCNDSGVRIVEASCSDKTVKEWLQAFNGGGDYRRLLVYNQPLVADSFEFTPLVILQLTRFKCGGLCVGMSWSHFLGDAFGATGCINSWGSVMAGDSVAPPIVQLDQPPVFPVSTSPPSCRSLKLLESLGDTWLTPNNLEMETHTFHFTTEHLTDLRSAENGNNITLSSFELISAVIWKALGTAEIITVVKKRERGPGLFGNHGVEIGVVKAEDVKEITDSGVLEIAKMINQKFTDETNAVEENGGAVGDFLVYGANLTFVDCSEVNLYGLQLNGHSPVFANLSLSGVGDEGAIVVVPAPEKGITVNAILPKDHLQRLKKKLSVDFCNI